MHGSGYGGYRYFSKRVQINVTKINRVLKLMDHLQRNRNQNDIINCIPNISCNKVANHQLNQSINKSIHQSMNQLCAQSAKQLNAFISKSVARTINYNKLREKASKQLINHPRKLRTMLQ